MQDAQREITKQKTEKKIPFTAKNALRLIKKKNVEPIWELKLFLRNEMGTYEGYFCIKYFYLLTVVFHMWCHAQKTTFPQMLLILCVCVCWRVLKCHHFSNSAANAPRVYEKPLLQPHCLFSIWLFPPLSVPTSVRKIVKGIKHVRVIVFMLCVFV